MGTIFKRKLLSITAIRKNYCSFDANLHASYIMHHLFDDKKSLYISLFQIAKIFWKWACVDIFVHFQINGKRAILVKKEIMSVYSKSNFKFATFLKQVYIDTDVYIFLLIFNCISKVWKKLIEVLVVMWASLSNSAMRGA